MLKIKDVVEKMDPTLLKEFLRTLIIGGKLPSSNGAGNARLLPDATAAQLTNFLTEITSTRNRNFEIHLKKCLQIFTNDIKKVCDEIADFENNVRSLEQNLVELKRGNLNETELCARLQDRIHHLLTETAKVKEERSEEIEKSEEKWSKEVSWREN